MFFLQGHKIFRYPLTLPYHFLYPALFDDSPYSISITPDQQSFVALPEDSMLSLSEALGQDSFRVTVTVRNNGPSSSHFAMLTIYWPFMDPDETDQFFLYTTGITTVSCEVMYVWMHAYCHTVYIFVQGAPVTCGMEYINPRNLAARRKRQSEAVEVPTEVIT